MVVFGIKCHHLQRLFQVVAWLLILAIVMLSLGPPSTRPVTSAGHNFEHLLIFVATGAAFGLGYPRRFLLLPIALLAFTGAIEVAQMMVPGRHARLSDFLTDAAASCVGIGLSFVLVKLTAAVAKS
jgi:VanZ family protein